jgi:hypothetical protein
MLPLFISMLDPIGKLNQAGIDASLAWGADWDSDALVMVQADAENLGRLERFLARPMPEPA